MPLTVTSTGSKFLRNVNINDLEWPWTPKIGVFSFFLQFSAAEEWIATRLMKIDQDYLWTGTAVGSRASHEHYLRFFVLGLTLLCVCLSVCQTVWSSDHCASSTDCFVHVTGTRCYVMMTLFGRYALIGQPSCQATPTAACKRLRLAVFVPRVAASIDYNVRVYFVEDTASALQVSIFLHYYRSCSSARPSVCPSVP